MGHKRNKRFWKRFWKLMQSIILFTVWISLLITYKFIMTVGHHQGMIIAFRLALVCKLAVPFWKEASSLEHFIQ